MLLQGLLRDSDSYNADRLDFLETLLTRHVFDSVREEIFFFKTAWPTVMATLYYYDSIADGESLAPGGPEAQNRYWYEERRVVRKLLYRQRLFLHDCTKGKGKAAGRKFCFIRVGGESIPGDSLLLAKLLSQQKYLQYIKQKLAGLKKSVSL